MLFAYDIFLILYRLGIGAAAWWKPKARQWIQGRKNIYEHLKEAIEKGEGPILWVHCSSLGEFEQGRPVLEGLKQSYPNHRILLTFFSPSGYEVRKNHPGADLIFYLPLDGRINSRRFLDIVHPVLAIFVKYESWFHYLGTLKKRNIPTLLISAIFTPKQHFFGPLGGFLRTLLESYSHLFVQDLASAEILKKFKLSVPFSIAGDTRFDRVTKIVEHPFHHTHIENFCAKNDVLIAGSSWKEDEEMLAALLNEVQGIKLIIAPHETGQKHIHAVKQLFNNSVLLSEAEDSTKLTDANVLIIDCIGLLSKLYRFATISYVGGGFNAAGIHNILEAAAYGKTVIFGPHHDRTSEAASLIAAGAGFSYSTKETLIEVTQKLIDNPTYRVSLEKIANAFVSERKGATDAILGYIAKNRLLSNS